MLFIKLFFFISVKNEFILISLGGGSDAEAYNAFATSSEGFEANIWPTILNFLNDLGVYSREGISYIFLFFNMFVIPHLVARLSGLSFKSNQKYYLYSFLLCLVYPTLYFYTFDVYRDLFMVVVFLTGCFFVKKLLNSFDVLSLILYFIVSVLIGFFLLALRPYLGYTFLISLFLLKIKLTKKRIIFFATLYLFALFTANYLGFFDILVNYRSGFEEMDGGSNLGLDFSNPLMFIPNFMLSILGQLFGLYIANPLAIVLLVIETVPFFFMMIYIVKNIRLADSFARFLIIFFILYASVWLIANDNLGTAVRLRLYNYLSVYICFFYILKIKNQTKRVGV